jgi:predicted nucleic acid-binding protein
MIAVADASPLCYLVLIGEIDLLPQLFGRVIAPEVVIAEWLHEHAPDDVRAWASNLPPWIRREPTANAVSAGTEKLQAGERSAIALAESLKANLILLDEKAARRVAEERGLPVTGTLGVLGESHGAGPGESAHGGRPPQENQLPLFTGALESNARPVRSAAGSEVNPARLLLL